MVYGLWSKGRIESAREDAEQSDVSRAYTNLDAKEITTYHKDIKTYIPEYPYSEVAKKHGHGGSDFYCLHNAFYYIAGVKDAEIVDVYEALNAWMCGFFGYISVLNGGIPIDIPDLHDLNVREKYRNDNRCTDPNVEGDQLLCTYSKGEPEIPDAVYEAHKKAWEEDQRTIEYGMKDEK